MQKIEKDTFLRSFKVISNQSFDLFLGSGACISSGIPSGDDLILHFKREILNSNGEINGKKFKDLKVEANKRIIESYFEQKEQQEIRNPYSYYFQQCYPDPEVRKEFLTNLVRDKKPSIGFKCLAELLAQHKINVVWTTNFDDLIEKAVNQLHKSPQIVSPENSGSVQNYRTDIPTVVKLHGDFRYDPLQNTDTELKSVEENLHNFFVDGLQKKGLLVIGYSGNDESVLRSLERALESPNAFPKGLVWCIPKGIEPNKRLISIIDKANEHNNRSGFMEIDSFDYFLYELYKICELTNDQIDHIAKEHFEKRKTFRLTQNQSNTTPILLNSIKANHFPKSVFSTQTNIQGQGKWKKLKEIIRGSNIVASFHKGGNLAFFGKENEIKDVFNNYITDDLKLIDIPEGLFYNPESFYVGMLYDMIEKLLVDDYGLSLAAKGRQRKVYSNQHPLSQEEINTIPPWMNFSIPKGISVFEAFEFKVEIVNKELFFLINPTIHLQTSSGEEPKKNVTQNIINTILSNRYNNKFGKKLTLWLKILKEKNANLTFRLGDFEIKLSTFYSTAAKKPKDDICCFENCDQYGEPAIYFHHQDDTKQSIHPINGLKVMGPLEESYATNNKTSQLKLGIITLDTGFKKVQSHLESLLNPVSPSTETDYLKEYPGFDEVYKKQLYIPESQESEYVVSIAEKDIQGYSAVQFYDLIKSKVDKLTSKNTELDCVAVYIPDSWNDFRELKDEQTYFDLHDSLKLYAAKKGLHLQFIEDKSINYKDQAKIRWWLSLGLYVKSNGTPSHRRLRNVP